MHGPQRRQVASTLASFLLVVVLAACSGGGTPPPSPPPASPGPSSPAAPSPTPGAVGFVIRASWTQALPPRSQFGTLPLVVVTSDGRVLTQGAVPAIYPGPLVAPIIEQPMSAAGVAALLAAATDAGLLRPGVDFTGGALPPGAAAARLQLVVDGVAHDLVGDANAAPCAPPGGCPSPQPGTPAAFAWFWNRLMALTDSRGPELGAQRAHVPAAYAIIVGPPPEPWPSATPFAWPAVGPALDAFGAPVRGEPGTRCGTATGDLAAALRPLFAGATQLTPVVATASASATHGLSVRPLLPGDDDPCAAIVE